MDDVRWKYFDEMGYDREMASRHFHSGRNIPEKLSYARPFEVHAIERALAEHPRSVIDFGASNSVYEDPLQFSHVEQVLAACPNVILLLPSRYPEESVEILKKRLTQIVGAKGEAVSQELLDLNEYFVRHPSNYRLARMVVYTEGKSPEETCEACVRIIKGSK